MLNKIDVFFQSKFQSLSEYIYYHTGVDNFQISTVLVWLAMFCRALYGYLEYLEDKTTIFNFVLIAGAGIFLFIIDVKIIQKLKSSTAQGFKNSIGKIINIGIFKLVTGAIIIETIIKYIFQKEVPDFYTISFCVDFLFFYFVSCEKPTMRKHKKKNVYIWIKKPGVG